MIKEYFYSTLTEELFDERSLAEKAEDEYVEAYFKNLSIKAAAKRRIINGEVNKPKSNSKKPPKIR